MTKPDSISAEKLASLQSLQESFKKAEDEWVRMHSQTRIKELEALCYQKDLRTEILRTYLEMGMSLEDEIDLATGEIRWHDQVKSDESAV